MTTNVDILFRELPSPASTEPIRKNDQPRPDVDRVKTDDAQSKYEIGNKDDKSFSDHLDETVSVNTKETNTDDELTTDKAPGETALTEEEKQSNNTDGYKTEATETKNNQNIEGQNIGGQTAEQYVQSNNGLLAGESQTNASNAITVNEQKSAVKINNDQTTTVIASGAAATPQKQVQNDEPLKSKQNPTATEPGSIRTTVGASADASSANISNAQISGRNSDQKASEQNSATDHSIISKTSNSVEEANNNQSEPHVIEAKVAATTVPDENISKSSPEANTQLPDNLEQPAVNQTPDRLAVKSPDTDVVTKEIAPVAPEEIVAADDKLEKNLAATTAPAANNFENQNDDILKKGIPTETVAVENTKTTPVAPGQPQNLAAKNATNNAANSEKPSSKKAAGVNQTSPSGQAQSSQNSTQQASLQNGVKSDISLDFGALNQKSDPAPLQPLNLNGQSSLSNGALMTVQDISVQRSVESLASAIKTETPITPKIISDQITVAINRNVVNGQNNFSIRLHPAELGQVDIRLEFAADGKMQASMIVENERTLTMLQRDQNALEKALQDAGLNMNGKNMNFSLMKQNQENRGDNIANSGNSDGNDFGDEELSPVAAMQQVSMGYSDQAIDISV